MADSDDIVASYYADEVLRMRGEMAKLFCVHMEGEGQEADKDDVEEDVTDYNDMTVTGLKELLRRYGQKLTGNKAALVARMQAHGTEIRLQASNVRAAVKEKRAHDRNFINNVDFSGNHFLLDCLTVNRTDDEDFVVTRNIARLLFTVTILVELRIGYSGGASMSREAKFQQFQRAEVVFWRMVVRELRGRDTLAVYDADAHAVRRFVGSLTIDFDTPVFNAPHTERRTVRS